MTLLSGRDQGGSHDEAVPAAVSTAPDPPVGTALGTTLGTALGPSGTAARHGSDAAAVVAAHHGSGAAARHRSLAAVVGDAHRRSDAAARHRPLAAVVVAVPDPGRIGPRLVGGVVRR
ncbi:hypothetical protein ACWEPZ_06335 [Streptomyces sp. NPDC004288]